MKLLASALALTASLLLSTASHAANIQRSVCVFDIIGASGDFFSIMRDLKTEALNWGVDLQLKPYTDEQVAAEDLMGRQCDAALLTGIRGRQFVSFTGSMDSIGAIPDYDTMRTVISVLASGNPRINEKLISGPFEFAGIVPMGAAYLFVKDNNIRSVEQLAGLSISVMEYDSAQANMASRVGMSPVMSDITNFSTRFNNHSVDTCFAPIFGFSALELYRGMGPDGGIVDVVLGQLSSQLIVRRDLFPEEFPAQARQFMAGQFDRAMQMINNASGEVDDKWWIRFPEEEHQRYDVMFRDARIDLTAAGVYDRDMMSLLRRVRCNMDSGRAECSDPLE